MSVAEKAAVKAHPWPIRRGGHGLDGQNGYPIWVDPDNQPQAEAAEAFARQHLGNGELETLDPQIKGCQFVWWPHPHKVGDTPDLRLFLHQYWLECLLNKTLDPDDDPAKYGY